MRQFFLFLRPILTKTTLIALVLISQIITVYGQWEDQSINTDNVLTSTFFVNDDYGFVTAQNQIFKTEDGGDTWLLVQSINDVSLYGDISAINDSLIIAVGGDFGGGQGIIERSTDGGRTWSNRFFLGIPTNLRSVFFSSDDIGYSCGSLGTILKTIDGGFTWTEIDPGPADILTSVFFINDTTGFVVGGCPSRGEIFKTTDGGSTWDSVDSPAQEFIQSVFFTDDQNGYCVGWNGEIIKTTDCGNTWTFQNSVSMEGNLEIQFTDQNTGYIAGGSDINQNSLIQKTTNAGEDWADISPETTNGLIGIHFPSNDVGYAVGSDGLVLKTTTAGVTTTSNNIELEDSSFRIFPTPTTSILTIESDSHEELKLIRLYSSQGVRLQEYHPGVSSFSLDLSHQKPNVYYVEIHTEQSKGIKKIVKL